MNTFKEYLETINDYEHSNRIQEIINWVEQSYPNLTLKIKWKQPMFIKNKTFIIGFSVAKNHISFSPEEAVIEMFSDEIRDAGYEHTKVLAKIKRSDAVDYELLAKLIEFNIMDKGDYPKFFR